MPSITLNTTAAEANRLQAWATASGFPDVKSLIVATMTAGLQQFEAMQDSQQFAGSYAPIKPS